MSDYDATATTYRFSGGRWVPTLQLEPVVVATIRKPGWGFPLLAKKAHWFEADARSKCGRWAYTGTTYNECADANACRECVRRGAKTHP